MSKLIVSCFSKELTGAEYQAMKQAEIEHGKNIAVRLNPQNFRVEYYNVKTGKVVSSHI